MDDQVSLETSLRKQVLSDPTSQSFQSAYDRLHTFFIEKEKADIYPAQLKWFSKAFIKTVGTHKSVLDIGTGNGKMAIALSQKQNEITGIDISQVAIDTARKMLKKIPGHQKLNIKFELGDARKLQFPDGEFDFVVSHDLVEHITETDFIIHLTEVRRVLKSGGSYLFWTPSSLLGGSSLGLHLKEYTVCELVVIAQKLGFDYIWFDLRWFLAGILVRVPSQMMIPIILYEKALAHIIRFIPKKIKKLFVPPLMFRFVKPMP